MGNRAIVRFPDASIEVYLHWNADDVIDWLREAAPNMRQGDGNYAAARFIGLCANMIDGGLSLGVMPINSCDDGIIYSVNTNTGKVKRGARIVTTLKLGQF